MPDPLDVADLRGRVQEVLDQEERRQATVLAELGPDVADLSEGVFRLLRGGKRLRAAFLYWAYRAAGGADSDSIVRVAASMEMFQAAALIHDDVMDHSDLRRGRPTAHRRLAARHRDEGWEGDPQDFGDAGAILSGDLCLVWTDALYTGSGLPVTELDRGRAAFDAMRTQLMGGQYLDMLHAVRDWSALPTDVQVAQAMQVLRFKSANYTVAQPLQIGAACAGADAGAQTALSSYGMSLGEAFQLRDDLLGVFGDPGQTGKPAGDDLCEGKRTVLVAFALDGAQAGDRARFDKLFGSPALEEADLAWLRELCVRSGAVERVEAMITERADAARGHLAAAILDHSATTVLHNLIDVTTARAA